MNNNNIVGEGLPAKYSGRIPPPENHLPFNMQHKRALRMDYAFSVGKIRALEKFLIHQEVFQDAIDEDLEEALKLFVESDLYSEDLLHVKTSGELENILAQEIVKLQKLVKPLLLDSSLIQLIDCKDYVLGLAICKRIGSDFLVDYLRQIIDMHNIKTFLRLYILKQPQELLNDNLYSGGFIPKEQFKHCFNKELELFINRLEFVHKNYEVINYGVFLGQAIKKLETENSFIDLEREIINFLMQNLKPAKYISFGPEPVIAYYWAKINEINLIRLIILGKFNNLAPELIKRRVGLVYA